MAKNSEDGGRNWTDTLFMPKTDFPMRAGLPKLEPRLLERWQKIGLYDKLRAQGKGREKMVLHDGPPYANGNIHIGHALNKILKDLVVKSQQMLGRDSNYVPGWDCHGLPIEWKIEEQYRAKGKEKPAFDNAQEINAFREECRAFATKWVDVQREEFKRLGVVGDWDNPYLTMAYPAEATIARELMQFAKSGALYRGSKPVMWSVVEKTVLAEAEIEYHDHQSDQVWVKFPITGVRKDYAEELDKLEKEFGGGALEILNNCSVVIWTTTPWTIPGNRAICYSTTIEYAIYEITETADESWVKKGERLLLAKNLVAEVMKASRVPVDGYKLIGNFSPEMIATCAHPLRGFANGYNFDIPLLDGDHVTDDTGTGFVHTAPGHGTDDYIVWIKEKPFLEQRKIKTDIPFTVDGDGVYTDQAPGFAGKRVLKENGSKGDANDAVIKALADAGNIIARSRLKHQYPHSWRSKKPVIFRNTPQWFISMDKPPLKRDKRTLRDLAFEEINNTKWVPATGQNRINGMIETHPDWVVSRQRAWGVPITVFRNPETDQVIPGPDFEKSDELIARIENAFHAEGADVWFRDGAKEKFLNGLVDNPDDWDQVRDVLDVWFDSGCTHAFTLEDGDAFPGLQGINRANDGGKDRVMYLEGSDQHRGWFRSSLLESCGTRGHAPYDIVFTHGFLLDEKGQEKMSKSKGNALAPQAIFDSTGADILRLWVASADTTNDIRFGPAIMKSASDNYRKLRNTMRWMLGALGHFEDTQRIATKDLPDLERLMLHELSKLDEEIRAAYDTFDFRRVMAALAPFLNTDLSAFYFDIRKDTLYCEAHSSVKRHATLTVIDEIYAAVTRWMAPILSFTAEEAWLVRNPDNDGSVHLEPFPTFPSEWRDDALAEKWETIRSVRRVVTGALEIERAEKRIGSSLESAPEIYIADKDVFATLSTLDKQDLADICITSDITVINAAPPSDAFTLSDVEGVGVVPTRAEGTKCARSWRITQDVGSDPRYPDLSARDAAAVAEFDALHGVAGGDA